MQPLIFASSARSVSSQARLGCVHTPNGSFDTPAFMPVGTRGSVKGILPHLVHQTGAQIVLANTYHLLLRPGPDLIHSLGGLHAFTNWHQPILTDSGGYQAYSLAATNSITDDGVTFKSIVDGSLVHLSPERAIDVQNLLGPDIIMAFDDCPPSIDPLAQSPSQARLLTAVDRDTRETSHASRPFARPHSRAYDHAARLKIANERTVHWLERCKAAHIAWHDGRGHRERALFGIIQGGTDLDQRKWCLERITNIDLPGYAIGGVAVGEHPDDIARVVTFTAPQMPADKPRYLMGVGYERDILAAVLSGIDMFDCVLPTRNGRNANAFTPTGQIRLRNAQYADDPRPIHPGCDCLACAGHLVTKSFSNSEHSPLKSASTTCNSRENYFSRAYIRHLFMAQEMLGPILVSLHNLRHFQRFMCDIRATILSDDWNALISRWPVAKPGLDAARSLGVLT